MAKINIWYPKRTLMRILYADSDQVGQINFIAALKANEDWSAKYAFAKPAMANAMSKEAFDIIICSEEFIDDILPIKSANTVLVTLGDLEEFNEVQDLLDKGVDHYLKKPFCSETFLRLTHSLNLEAPATSLEQDVTPDFAYLERITKGRTALKLDLMEIYISVVSEEVEKIKKALVEKDNQVIATSTHKMKSNVRMMGLQTLMELVDKIETEAKMENPPLEFYDIVSDSCLMLELSMKQIEPEIEKMKSLQTN